MKRSTKPGILTGLGLVILLGGKGLVLWKLKMFNRRDVFIWPKSLVKPCPRPLVDTLICTNTYRNHLIDIQISYDPATSYIHCILVDHFLLHQDGCSCWWPRLKTHQTLACRCCFPTPHALLHASLCFHILILETATPHLRFSSSTPQPQEALEYRQPTALLSRRINSIKPTNNYNQPKLRKLQKKWPSLLHFMSSRQIHIMYNRLHRSTPSISGSRTSLGIGTPGRMAEHLEDANLSIHRGLDDVDATGKGSLTEPSISCGLGERPSK